MVLSFENYEQGKLMHSYYTHCSADGAAYGTVFTNIETASSPSSLLGHQPYPILYFLLVHSLLVDDWLPVDGLGVRLPALFRFLVLQKIVSTQLQAGWRERYHLHSQLTTQLGQQYNQQQPRG